MIFTVQLADYRKAIVFVEKIIGAGTKIHPTHVLPASLVNARGSQVKRSTFPPGGYCHAILGMLRNRFVLLPPIAPTALFQG
jgi:hypothetical protein